MKKWSSVRLRKLLKADTLKSEIEALFYVVNKDWSLCIIISLWDCLGFKTRSLLFSLFSPLSSDPDYKLNNQYSLGQRETNCSFFFLVWLQNLVYLSPLLFYLPDIVIAFSVPASILMLFIALASTTSAKNLLNVTFSFEGF